MECIREDVMTLPPVSTTDLSTSLFNNGREIYAIRFLDAEFSCVASSRFPTIAGTISHRGMRRDNRDLKRFRLELESLRELVRHGLPETITDLNLQAGEDPVGVREIILPLIETIRSETKLGVSVCLGTLDRKLYDELKAGGSKLLRHQDRNGQPGALPPDSRARKFRSTP